MRLAYIHTTRWPSHSPSTTFVTLAAEGIGRAGAEVHLFVQNNSTMDTGEILTRDFSIEATELLHIHRFPPSTATRSHQRYFIAVSRRVKNLHRKGEFDAVISRSPGFLPYLLLLKRTIGTQAVFESHDFFADRALRTDLEGRKGVWRYQFLERAIVPRLSGVICLLDTQKHLYQHTFPHQRFLLARTGVYRVDPSPVEERRTELAYVGSLDRRKDVESFLPVVAALPTITLRIVGGKTPSEIERFRALCRSCGIADRVHITGWQSWCMVSKLIEKASFGIIPLRDSFFNRYLTSPLKLFDFYSRGVPVIAPDYPSVRELVDDGKTGFLYDPGDVTSITHLIADAFSNRERYAEMVAHTTKRATELQWKNRGMRIVEWVRRLHSSTG
jgi:glycosyltransferase involved in cell wall biosynthesis